MNEVFPFEVKSFGDLLWWLAGQALTLLADFVLWLIVPTGQVIEVPAVT